MNEKTRLFLDESGDCKCGTRGASKHFCLTIISIPTEDSKAIKARFKAKAKQFIRNGWDKGKEIKAHNVYIAPGFGAPAVLEMIDQLADVAPLQISYLVVNKDRITSQSLREAEYGIRYNYFTGVLLSEMVFERARRLVEMGGNVVVFMDSLTRMSRAFNNLQKGSGRILSGGIDSRTMEKPRRFFGSARNVEDGGSLTVVATCLVDTGSRMDEVIFQEFKGTGNMELVLDRKLFDKRIFPCINIPQSGTRKEEKLYPKEQVEKLYLMRRALSSLPPEAAMELLLQKVREFPTNEQFLSSLQLK